ncbi:hypothetical protein DdX_11765 [Ditylenchus destructor]|uniref:Secreted protein n=1 Tax=Ditylenchus destructor TaxID=166010 RepID=A0AAD4QXZ5_9BILA|nr:hypothetical protein DdX_11765 [Ditylenchus destructor]
MNIFAIGNLLFFTGIVLRRAHCLPSKIDCSIYMVGDTQLPDGSVLGSPPVNPEIAERCKFFKKKSSSVGAQKEIDA